MAIGDSFAALLGTAATNRQPSSGVFENISSVVKEGTTDYLAMYDGSDVSEIYGNDATTGTRASSPISSGYNQGTLIGNTVYFRKNGTTDRCGINGVQVDA